MLIAYSLIYTLPLAAKLPFNWRELTPVSMIALDQFVLWVNSGAAVQDGEGVLEAAQGGKPVVQDGRHRLEARGSRPLRLHGEEDRRQVRVPALQVGGEAATQLVGNHTAANVNNPSENLEVWRAGQVSALCVFDNERMSYKTKVTADQSWNDIPTCKEQGLDVEYPMLRGLFLPPKVNAGAGGLLRRPVQEDRRHDGVQGLHGKAGAEARS